MKKKISILNKKIKKFIDENKLYTSIVLLLLIFNLILTIIETTLGLIFFVVFVILNIIFIKIGGLEKMRKKTNNKEKNKKKKKIGKVILNVCLFLLLIGLIGGIIFSIYIVIKAPDFDPDNLYRAEASIVYDKDNNQVTKLGVEKRKKVSYEELPQVLVDAIIATEDSRFMQHNGFDLPRFLKASAGQVVNKITGHGNAGGGSTLTMQVSKNNYTSVESSGFEGIVRKFTDIYISIFKLEKSYSKEEIIEFYVNTPYLGNSSYGVEQACQSYFGKSVSDINLSEAAIIAGLFQAPSSYDPYRYPEATAERRETVLYLMKKHGYISEEEQKIANSIPVESLLRSSNPESDDNPYQSYIDIVISEVEEKTGYSPYTTGMKIYTNLDTSKQEMMNDIMSGKTWTWKDDKVQAGVSIVDINSGALVAVGGGRNRTGERQLNFATDIKRQIGSCAKPLFDYGPAYEYNNASLANQVLDAPYSYGDGKTIKNADGSYGGMMTYKYAMAASRNIPAVKVFQSVDNTNIIKFVTSLGITPDVDSTGYIHQAHALGAFSGSNPTEMAGAYAAFGNGGYYTKPYTINKVEYIDTGKTISLKNKKTKVMSDSTAYMITDALLYAVEGYSNIGGRVSGVRLAAKTGTSNFSDEARKQYGYPSSANMDMWVTGYTPEYAVSLWYGYETAEKGYYLASDGYTTRGKLFRQIISGISDKSGAKQFTVPSSIVKVTVEKETDPLALPSANTPADMKVTEYFKKGTEPTEVSPRYNTLPDPTGLTAKTNGNNIELSWKAVSQPNYLTDDYFRSYYKKLYSNQLEAQLSSRKASMGEYGYEVFVKDNPTGATSSLGFTTNTTFKTTKQNKDVTYIVKTSYSILKLTQSPGASTVVKADKTNNNDDNKPTKDLLTIDIDSNAKDYTTLSSDGSVSFQDIGIIVNNNGQNVTKQATITTACSNGQKFNTNGATFTFTKEGTYTITYTATYNGQTKTDSRTITVKPANTSSNPVTNEN